MADFPLWNDPAVVLRSADMSVMGQLFAVRFVTDNQVELYIEDDENYFLKARFSRAWLGDLADVADIASRRDDNAVVGTPSK